MSKVFLGGFIVAAVVAVGGADYVNRARHGAEAGERFGPAAYFRAIPARMTGMAAGSKAERQAAALQAGNPRDLLPEAPQGWTRRDWDEAAAARLDRRYDMARDEFLPEEVGKDPALRALSAVDKTQAQRRDLREVWVYQRGNEIISMRLRRQKSEADAGIAGLGLQIVQANLTAMSSSDGYAMVGGVAFRERYGLMGTRPDERPYRVLTGQIGAELSLTLRAQASDEAILTLLKAVDYERLNASLETPVAGIGNDAPVLATAAGREMADERGHAEDAALIERGRAAEARLRALGRAGEGEDGLAPAGSQAALEAVSGTLGTGGIEIASGGDGQEAAGGLWSALRAFAGNRAEADAADPAETPREVRVVRLGEGGTCSSGVGKRCSTGN